MLCGKAVPDAAAAAYALHKKEETESHLSCPSAHLRVEARVCGCGTGVAVLRSAVAAQERLIWDAERICQGWKQCRCTEATTPVEHDDWLLFDS